jgi:hypothetical protein
MNKFYALEKSNDGTATIHLYDEVGAFGAGSKDSSQTSPSSTANISTSASTRPVGPLWKGPRFITLSGGTKAG